MSETTRAALGESRYREGSYAILTGVPAVLSLLDRPTYLYAEVDRIVALPAGTSRRWINGYRRGDKTYQPILRAEPLDTEWASWGEFVETRILAEYRDRKIPTLRLRGAVESLRQIYDLRYPLAHLQPYLAAEHGELALESKGLDPNDVDSLILLRTKQTLLDIRAQSIIRSSALERDDRGRPFASEIPPDSKFADIVVNPKKHSGEPTIMGRRVTVAAIAGMVQAGEPREALAADFGVSLSQIDSAVEFAREHAA